MIIVILVHTFLTLCLHQINNWCKPMPLHFSFRCTPKYGRKDLPWLF